MPISDAWPMFWTNLDSPFHESVMGWSGKIRVDNKMYSLVGHDLQRTFIANATNLLITPTCSIYNLQAGPMNVSVTFTSLIEPSDWVLQSLPFAYLSVDAISTDGQVHNVQLYSDISAGVSKLFPISRPRICIDH
ncbi:hypothetical protein C8Q78DRAFT_1074999 [Trametes maxima]|nr:hypothetical protein C8Q78DRAFT_1074999 [Trametes maxima]